MQETKAVNLRNESDLYIVIGDAREYILPELVAKYLLGEGEYTPFTSLRICRDKFSSIDAERSLL